MEVTAVGVHNTRFNATLEIKLNLYFPFKIFR